MEAHTALEGTDRPILPRAPLNRTRAYVRVAMEDLDHLEGLMPEEAREELRRHLEAFESGVTNLLDDGEDAGDGA